MDNLIYLYLAAMVFAAAGFIFGAVKYLRPHKPLYAIMIVLGVGCIMIGRVYTFLRMLTGLETTGIFHVGMFGNVGAFAFFFSANFGQIDSLVDGGEKEFAKYRIIALFCSVIIGALYAVIFFSPTTIYEKIGNGISAAAITLSCYFHVKHLLIPDIDYGVVRCQRMYNALALTYGILCMTEMIALSFRIDVLVIAVFCLECITSLLLIPALDRGVRKWSK